MTFLISDESRKISYWIYGYGSAGIIAKAYSLGLAKLPGGDYLTISGATLNASGVLALPVYFFILLFLVRVYWEYNISSLSTVAEEYQKFVDLPKNIANEKDSGDPQRATILNRIRRRAHFFRRSFSISSVVRNAIEIVLPLLFSALCVYVTFGSMITAIHDILLKI